MAIAGSNTVRKGGRKCANWQHGGLCLVALASPAGAQAQADAVADFYQGKTITVIVGYTAGGGYDLYARALSRHMGKHLPGNPNFIVQNITGAGSLNAANNLYNVAPKDGTVFGTFGRGLAMEPLIGTATRASSTPPSSPGSAAAPTRFRSAPPGTPRR